MSNYSITFFAILLSVSWAIAFSEEPKHQAQPTPMALKHFVALEGEWIGTHINHEDEKENVSLIYRTVSGGTAVEERIFANTPKEMITMYHGDQNRLLMTHYCMLGNQPRLKLENIDQKTLVFTFLDGVGIDRETTGHMGSMNMTIIDESTLIQEWSYYENGEKLNSTRFIFHRK